MTIFGGGGWSVVLLLPALVVGAEDAVPLSAAEQRDLEKQVAEKRAEAGKAEAAEDFDKARQLRKEVLDLAARRYGAADWPVTDARLALQMVQRLEQLTADERRQLWDALQWNNRVYYLWRAGKSREALPLAQKAADIRRKLLGEDHPDYARSLFNLGAQYQALGSYRMAQLNYEKALAIFQKALGEDHPQTARSYSNLASTLDDRGQYSAAESFFRKALAIFQKALGDDHPDTAASYDNLALNLNAQGRYAEAEADFRQALTLHRKLLGDEHPATARSYNNLALNLDDQGQYAAAEALFRKALAIFEKAPSEDLLDRARCYKNLALNLNEQGQYAAAEPLLRKALVIFQQTLDENHPDTARSYNHLASNLTHQGQYAAAELLCRKALAIRLQVLGEEHPDTASSYGTLASNLDAQGQYAAAEPLLRKALAINQKAMGEHHPHTAGSYNNLARNLAAQGQYAAAEPLFRKALAIKQKALGEDHPHTAQGYNNLAFNLNAQGEHAAAEPLCRKALAIYQKALGDDHPETANCYNILAGNLEAQGRYAAAEPLCRRALAIRQKALGDDHPDTAGSYNHLAVNLNAQGQYSAAEPLFRKALAICQKVGGENHPDTARIYNNLAFNLAAQGQYAAAEPLFRKGLAIRQQALGEDHRDTANTYQSLATNLAAQGQYAEAVQMAQAAATHFHNIRQQVSFGGLERSTFTTKRSPWPLLAALRARTGEPAEAWRALEENLARGLLDDLDAQRRPLNADERRRLDLLRGQLDQLDKQHTALAGIENPTPQQQQRRRTLPHDRDRLQGELAQFQADLRQRYGPAAGQVYGLSRLQQHLPTDAAVLIWLDRRAWWPQQHDPNGDHWACLVRASGPPVWVRLPGSGPEGAWTPADDALPQELRTRLQKPSDSNDWQDLAQRLAAQRLTPLDEFLRGEGDRPAVKHLVILPSDAMAGIPIEVLSSRYSISYAPSGTLFAYLQEQRLGFSAGPLLALGDPVFPPTAAPPPRPAQGVLVASVNRGTNAHYAGMQAGDVLLRYADVPLANAEELEKAMADQESDPDITRVLVELWRDGQVRTIQVRPGALGIALNPKAPAMALRSRWEGEDALRASRHGGVFASLPGTRREVQAIARLFGQHKLLLGSEASEVTLDELAQTQQLKQYRYLHLATHGVANGEHGMRSFLALAQDRLPDPLTLPPPGQKVFDGRLSAADIVRSWTLEADLVTLSACETGLGEHQGGEGYVGFAQALFLAGARSLVLSQWKVDDDATALLMVRFYQNLLGQRPGLEAPLGKAAALAEAKTWLRRLSSAEARTLKANLRQGSRGTEEPRPAEGVQVEVSDRPYQHPYFWAGFILVGDPGDVTAAQPVLSEVTPIASAAPAEPRRWWPWLAGSSAVAIGLVGGLVWLRCRRRH
jgi:tetratricopeptide (TPR) repeat protein